MSSGSAGHPSAAGASIPYLAGRALRQDKAVAKALTAALLQSPIWRGGRCDRCLRVALSWGNTTV